MPRFKTILNRYLFAILAVAILSASAIEVPLMRDAQEAFEAKFGIPAIYLNAAIAGLGLMLLTILIAKVHARISDPMTLLAKQCSDGRMVDSLEAADCRETKLIRDCLRQHQSRSDYRGSQLKKMQMVLSTKQQDYERLRRKIEEYEDLVASYDRIRKELSYDLASLRSENKDLMDQLRKWEKQSAGGNLPHPLLGALESGYREIQTLAQEVLGNWDNQPLGNLKDALSNALNESEHQLQQIQAYREWKQAENGPEHDSPLGLAPSAESRS